MVQLTLLVSRYRLFTLLGAISRGTLSFIFRPYPSRPIIFRGLLVSNLISFTPKSTRVWAPTP